MIIYKTTNLVNGKQYIGRDSRNNPNYLGSGTAIKNAIKKYGKENFIKEIIEECYSFEQMVEREEYWLNYYDVGRSKMFYNIHNSGNGVEQTLDIRRKIASAVSGEKNHFFGKHHTHESKKKIGDSIRGDKHYLYGKRLSDNHKRKIRESRAGWNKGHIICTHGKYFGEYRTRFEWCELLKISPQNFSKHLSGKKYKNGIKGNFFKWEHGIK